MIDKTKYQLQLGAIHLFKCHGIRMQLVVMLSAQSSREAARGEGSGFLDGQRGGAFPLRLGGGRADLEDQ